MNPQPQTPAAPFPPPGPWPVPASQLTTFGRENIRALRLFGFLNACRTREYAFSEQELFAATQWSTASWKTYRSKQLKNVVSRRTDGRFAVRAAFRRVPIQQFLANFTQARQLISEYERVVFGEVVEYEFLLPLSRENELQRTLDELFFADALEETARQIDVAVLQGMVARTHGETDDELRSRVCREVGSRFGGYSIVHVAGRFRSGELLSRSEASVLGATGFRYLIDETTAMVRFIVPLRASELGFTEDPRSVKQALNTLSNTRVADEQSLKAEVDLVRSLFFLFFVEAVVETVRGEEEIWLLETSPSGEHVFVWRRKG
jgi:Arc/MetJ family transcription regulator